MVLRGRGECSDLLPPDGEEYAARYVSKRSDGGGHVVNVNPAIARCGSPCRAAQRNERDAGRRGRLGCISGYHCGIGMCGIDERVDMFSREIAGQSCRAAKAADPHGNRLGCRRAGAAGEREHSLDIRAICQQSRELPCFRRAAEYENVLHAIR